MKVTTFIDGSRPFPASTCARLVLLAGVPGGNGPNGPKHMHCVARVIPDDMSGPDARQHHAFGALHAMLEDDVRTGRFNNTTGGPRHALAIVGMHQRKQSPVRLMAGDRRHAEKCIHLRRPEHAIGFDVPAPHAHLGGTERQTQLPFM